MKLDTKAILARAESATPGRWQGYAHESEDEDIQGVCSPDGGWVSVCDDMTEADQRFIAAARTDVPQLCAEIDRLRGLLRRIAGDDHSIYLGTVRDELLKELEP